MRHRLIWVLTSTVYALFLIACGATSVSEVASPDVVRCATSLSAPVPTVPAAGGRVSASVSAARECSWSASSDSAWMQVSPTSGQGEATVTLTVAANDVASSRTAALVVNNQRFSVAQEAAPCQYSLSSSSASIGASGGPLTVRVSAPGGCSWTAAWPAPWIHTQTTSGSGEATLGISVDANPGPARSAQGTIAGQMFTISQDAYVAPAPAPAPAPTPSPTPTPAPSPTPAPAPDPSPSPTPSPLCTYTLSDYAKDFAEKGGGGSFKVNTADGCSWSASSDSDWISIAQGSGSGTGDVKYSVDRNRTSAPRTGTISVAGQVYTITQKGG